MKKFCFMIAALIVVGTLLAACGATVEETPIPPTATKPPPTATITPIPPTDTPVPPTDTPTPVPPTPTFTPFPADQGSITLGSYQIEILRADILDGYVIREDVDFTCSPGTTFLPIVSDPKLNSLTVNIYLLDGDRESFARYACQVLEPDGNLILIENILVCQEVVSWELNVSSTDPNLMVYCPDGGPIDLAPVVEIEIIPTMPSLP
jgi:hypothetical protein